MSRLNSLICYASVLLVAFVQLLPGCYSLVGGTKARFNEVPRMFFFQVQGEFRCGGTVSMVDKIQVFITSARCVLKDPSSTVTYIPQEVTLVGGRFRLLNAYPPNLGCDTDQERKASKIIVHPDFKTDTLENDIAIIMFDAPFKETDSVKFVDMPSQGWGWGPQFPAQISGFGARGSASQLSDFLHVQHNLTTMADADCKAIETAPRTITIGKQICAPGFGLGGVGACDPDRGSPYILFEGIYHVLVGIISYDNTLTCGQPGIPTVLTQVSAYADWVGAQVKANAG